MLTLSLTAQTTVLEKVGSCAQSIVMETNGPIHQFKALNMSATTHLTKEERTGSAS